MSRSSSAGARRVALRRVEPDERATLDPLVDAYLAELALHRDVPVGPLDAASYEYLPLYFTEAGRHPFFLMAGEERIGFVFVREVEPESLIEMSEFYVRPAWRRSGWGASAASEVWRRFPGAWRLVVHVGNEAAVAFWPKSIAASGASDIVMREIHRDDGRLFEYTFVVPSG